MDKRKKLLSPAVRTHEPGRFPLRMSVGSLRAQSSIGSLPEVTDEARGQAQDFLALIGADFSRRKSWPER